MQREHPIYSTKIITALILALGLGMVTYLWPSTTGALAAPNRQADNEWEIPINLSRSGNATNPALIVDDTGLEHALWQEQAIDSLVYSQQTIDWAPSEPVEFPFGSRIYYPDLSGDEPTPLFTPVLVSNGGGSIHAFWIDDEQNLYHSRVTSADFANSAAWSERDLVAEAAVQLSAGVDEDQTLHIAYASAGDTETFDSGLYYLNSDDNGASWSTPQLLQSSRYYRALSPAELTLSTAIAGTGDQANVFVTWDNRVLDSVFLIHSTDGGATWGEAVTIDTRQENDPPDSVGPAELIATVHNSQLHLLWRAGHETQSCSLYHQWSEDGGATWQSRQRLLAESQSCPLLSQFVRHPRGPLLVVAALEQQGYVLAWDGQRWSDPQREVILGEFRDPETSRRIELQISRATINSEGNLMVIGSDTAQYSDVWLLSRSLDDTEMWFPSLTAWSAPAPISSNAVLPQSPVLVSDGNNEAHAFWAEQPMAGENTSPIYYAQMTDGQWSRPAPVLSSPEETASPDPAVAIGLDGRIAAVWQTKNGTLYFSQAEAQSATIAGEWSDARQLPLLGPGARSPQIAIGPDQTLYVVCAVTLNEGRGIYIIVSQDLGVTWSEPRRVFDGVAAGWDMIDEPQIAVSTDGSLHVLWKRFTLPPQTTPLSLHYIRSTDAANSWSEPELVDEGAIVWSALVTTGDQLVQSLWQRNDDERPGFHFSTSLDGGRSWDEAQSIPTMQNVDGAAAAGADAAGRTHFVVWTPREVLYQLWRGDTWTVGDSQIISDRDSVLMREGLAAAAAVSPGGQLTVIATGQLDDGNADEPQYRVLSIAQPLTMPQEAPTRAPQDATTSAPQPSPTTQLESTLAPTATDGPQVVASGNVEGGAPLLDTSDPLIVLIIGLVPVLLLVLIIVAGAVALRRR